jgi:hypothetical protein
MNLGCNHAGEFGVDADPRNAVAAIALGLQEVEPPARFLSKKEPSTSKSGVRKLANSDPVRLTATAANAKVG